MIIIIIIIIIIGPNYLSLIVQLEDHGHSSGLALLRSIMYLTSVSHFGWPSRAMHLGGLGLIRASP